MGQVLGRQAQQQPQVIPNMQPTRARLAPAFQDLLDELVWLKRYSFFSQNDIDFITGLISLFNTIQGIVLRQLNQQKSITNACILIYFKVDTAISQNERFHIDTKCILRALLGYTVRMPTIQIPSTRQAQLQVLINITGITQFTAFRLVQLIERFCNNHVKPLIPVFYNNIQGAQTVINKLPNQTIMTANVNTLLAAISDRCGGYYRVFGFLAEHPLKISCGLAVTIGIFSASGNVSTDPVEQAPRFTTK